MAAIGTGYRNAYFGTPGLVKNDFANFGRRILASSKCH